MEEPGNKQEILTGKTFGKLFGGMQLHGIQTT
jgi:hypothetical protein